MLTKAELEEIYKLMRRHSFDGCITSLLMTRPCSTCGGKSLKHKKGCPYAASMNRIREEIEHADED